MADQDLHSRTRVAVGVLLSADQRILVQKRREKGSLNRLWEFPGGKLVPGESPLRALRREVFEETGIQLREPAELVEICDFEYSDRSVRLYFFLVRLKRPVHTLRGRWVESRELFQLKMPAANQPFLRTLRAKLSQDQKKDHNC